jgi:hypothetical protein
MKLACATAARQLEDQLGVTYKTPWLLTQKLRRSMVSPVTGCKAHTMAVPFAFSGSLPLHEIVSIPPGIPLGR